MKFCKTWLQKYMALPPDMRSVSLSYKEWKKKLKRCEGDACECDLLGELRRQCELIDNYLRIVTEPKPAPRRQSCLCRWGFHYRGDSGGGHVVEVGSVKATTFPEPLCEFMSLNKTCLYKICKRIDKTLPETGAMKLLLEMRSRHFLEDYRYTFFKLESGGHAEECTICMEERDKYAILECGHYFCIDCFVAMYGLKGKKGTLRNILANTNRKLTCPMCRYEMEYDMLDSMHFWPKKYGRDMLTRLKWL